MGCATFDIGKTRTRLSLVNHDGKLIRIASRVTPFRNGPPYPHVDVDQLFAWMCANLGQLNRRHGFEHLVFTTHGATAALVAGDSLALPVMDYEWQGPGGSDADYEALRDPFPLSLTPSLPAGLNLGRQLFWQQQQWPAEFAATRSLLPYPQYWAWRFSGCAAAEATSLGCHTDLWWPLHQKPSRLAGHLGAAAILPGVVPAQAVLGSLRLPASQLDHGCTGVAVHCGIHDSAAAYHAHFPDPAMAGTLVSTGTWIVCMTPVRGGRGLAAGSGAHGTMSVHGVLLACSRFMGGRDFAAIAGAGAGGQDRATMGDLAAVLASGVLVLPGTATDDSAAVPERLRSLGAWPDTAAGRQALAALYCALRTDSCLEDAGAHGPCVVEGVFATDPLYCGILAALRVGEPVEASLGARGPTLGAAALALGLPASVLDAAEGRWAVEPLLVQEVRQYRDRWSQALHE